MFNKLISDTNSSWPFNPARWPFFYGWMILGWGTLGVLMSIPGQTMGVSAFTEYLLEALNISRDSLSLAYMFGTISSSLLLPLVGRIYDKIGVRPLAFLSALLLGVVLVYLSQVDRISNAIRSIIDSWWVTMVMIFFGFFLLRFFGQGVLTMVSRNMMMMWFEKRRGFATGFSNVFISLGFAFAPYLISRIIDNHGWRGAWIVLAIVVGVAFPVIVLIFFRNKPRDSGLEPDGGVVSKKNKKNYFPVAKHFTINEAIKNYSFWVFALFLAMQGLYVTGITFHVVSIFEEVNLSKELALSIFQPMAVVAVVVTLGFSALSDHIKLKYLLYIKGFGACLSTVSLVFLQSGMWAYHLLYIGTGILAGMFNVLNSVTWPRYFGTNHLGSITGQSVMMIVLGSALGPIMFSFSLSQFGSYESASWLNFLLFFLLLIGSFWANNPQGKYR